MFIKEAKDYVATYRVFGVDKGGLGAHQPPTSGVPGEKRTVSVACNSVAFLECVIWGTKMVGLIT